jgi:hypothetical protein
MINLKRITVTIDDDSFEWLQKQPRSFNLSKNVRDAIHKLMGEQEPEAEENDDDIVGEDEG